MIRHRIAGLFYAIGYRIDRSSGKLVYDNDLSFGDNRYHASDPDLVRGLLQLHTRPTTPVAGSYKPGRYTYAALTIGDQTQVTVFLNRPITRRLLTVLTGIDDAFGKYGEGRP